MTLKQILPILVGIVGAVGTLIWLLGGFRKVINFFKKWRSLASWESGLQKKQNDLLKRERELQWLSYIREENVAKLNSLVELDVANVRPIVEPKWPRLQVRFRVRNNSIFEISLNSFSGKVNYMAHDMGSLPPFFEKLNVPHQGSNEFPQEIVIAPELAKEIDMKEAKKEVIYWQFKVKASFSWDQQGFVIEKELSWPKR